MNITKCKNATLEVTYTRKASVTYRNVTEKPDYAILIISINDGMPPRNLMALATMVDGHSHTYSYPTIN